MNPLWQQYIQILNQVVKPALGCTEPIAAAYASAVARTLLGIVPEAISVQVSDNLYKNSMGVYVPGTGKIGLAIAAAAGAIAGNAEAGLEVLAAITPEQVAQAQDLIDAGKVKVERTETEEFIYCCVTLKAGEQEALVKICGGHTLIAEKRLNGEPVLPRITPRVPPQALSVMASISVLNQFISSLKKSPSIRSSSSLKPPN